MHRPAASVKVGPNPSRSSEMGFGDRRVKDDLSRMKILKRICKV